MFWKYTKMYILPPRIQLQLQQTKAKAKANAKGGGRGGRRCHSYTTLYYDSDEEKIFRGLSDRRYILLPARRNVRPAGQTIGWRPGHY